MKAKIDLFVTVGGENPRGPLTDESVDELAGAIRAADNTIIQPLLVRPFANGSFLVLDGHRRLAAAQRLGLTEISYVLSESELTDADVRLASNVREGFPLIVLDALGEPVGGLAWAVARRLAEGDISARALAARLGMVADNVSALQHMVRAPVALRRKIEAGEVALSTFALIKHDDVLQLAVGEMEGPVSLSTVKGMIGETRNGAQAPSLEEAVAAWGRREPELVDALRAHGFGVDGPARRDLMFWIREQCAREFPLDVVARTLARLFPAAPASAPTMDPAEDDEATPVEPAVPVPAPTKYAAVTDLALHHTLIAHLKATLSGDTGRIIAALEQIADLGVEAIPDGAAFLALPMLRGGVPTSSQLRRVATSIRVVMRHWRPDPAPAPLTDPSPPAPDPAPDPDPDPAPALPLTVEPRALNGRALVGDNVEMMAGLAEEVDMILTSPPYPNIGGLDSDSWLAMWKSVLSQFARVLRATGTLAVVLGHGRRGDGFVDASWMAAYLQMMAESGWGLVNQYAWVKPNSPPGGNPERFAFAGWESAWVWARQSDYYYAPARGSYAAKTIARAVGGHRRATPVRAAHGPAGDGRHVVNAAGPYQPNYLVVSSSGDQNRPRAAGGSFPRDLVYALLDQFCPPGGSILDPYAGVLTVPYVAEATGRSWIAIERNEADVQTGMAWLESAPLWKPSGGGER